MKVEEFLQNSLAQKLVTNNSPEVESLKRLSHSNGLIHMIYASYKIAN